MEDTALLTLLSTLNPMANLALAKVGCCWSSGGNQGKALEFCDLGKYAT